MTSATINSKEQLINALADGCKPRSEWRIGTENEIFLFEKQSLQPAQYYGPKGIHAVLTAFEALGWSPIVEGANLIALSKNNASITLEPGGQFELSGAPLPTLTASCQELHHHQDTINRIANQLGLGCLRVGFHPTLTRETAPIMPKARYDIMRAYMPTVGQKGLDMMLRTASMQVNLDFSNEQDMIQKMRVSIALQPLMTAMVANSPFLEGQESGYRSYRSHVWTETDNQRTGMLPFIFEDDFSFERYVDYALDVPMYFVKRDHYINAAGLSFRDFMEGNLSVYPGQKPTAADWNDHLTTIFTDVRLKSYIECRGADCVAWPLNSAITAFWVGLFYSSTALDAAWDVIRHWPVNELIAAHQNVGRQGFDTQIQGQSFQTLASIFLDIATLGLNALGEDSDLFLSSLRQIVAAKQSPADRLLALYRNEWQGDIKQIFNLAN